MYQRYDGFEPNSTLRTYARDTECYQLMIVLSPSHSPPAFTVTRNWLLGLLNVNRIVSLAFMSARKVKYSVVDLTLK